MKPTARNTNRMAWLTALLMNAVLFALIFIFLDVRYTTNDDSVILRAFMGYETGTPAQFSIYIHGLLAWPLYWLGSAFPGVPFFSYLQFGLLFLGLTVCTKSILQAFRSSSFLLGCAAGLAFLLLFGIKYTARPTYTSTAAILGAAAVMQLLSIDHTRPKGVVLSMLGAGLLAALAYALRQITLLAVLAYCGLAFVLAFLRWYGVGKSAKQSPKPMLVSLGLIAVLLGALAAGREIEIRALGMQEHLEWQQARISLVDYHDVNAIPQDVLDSVGWTPAVAQMVSNWSFLDENITAEAFRTLTEYCVSQDTRSLGQKAADAWQTMKLAADAAPEDMLLLAGGLFAALLCLTGLKRKNRWYVLAGVLGALGLAAAMLFYLALQGRLPIRAVLMAALPAAGLFFMFLPHCACKKLAAAGTALLILWSGMCLYQFLPGIVRNPEEDMALGSAMGDLEEYASWEPESLFIYDLALAGADVRPFPSYPDGMPHNVTFWGGWGARTAENTQLYANFDIDIHAFDPEVFLRGDVYVVSSRLEPGPFVILDWLREKVDPSIEYEIWSENGAVYVFQFYQP